MKHPELFISPMKDMKINKRAVILVPMPGIKVPDPETGKPLPERGRRVELNTYWMRRIKEGSVKVLETRKN